LELRSGFETTSKFQRLLGEVVLSYFVVQERDGQTDKKDIFGFPGGVRTLSRTWQSDKGSEARLLHV